MSPILSWVVINLDFNTILAFKELKIISNLSNVVCFKELFHISLKIFIHSILSVCACSLEELYFINLKLFQNNFYLHFKLIKGTLPNSDRPDGRFLRIRPAARFSKIRLK